MPDFTPEQQAEFDAGLEAALGGAPATGDPDDAFIIPGNTPPAAVDDGTNGEIDDELDPESKPPEGEDTPPVEGETPPEGKAPEEKPPEGEPAKPEEKKPDEPKVEEPPKEPTPEEDATLKASLKGRAKERFEQLSEEVGTLRKTLEEVGIKDLTELPAVVQRAKDGADMIDMVMQTGATGDQYGQVLEYMTLFNAAHSSNDPAKAKAAIDMLTPALQQLATIAGVEIGAIAERADPLAAHPDLQKLVEDGDLTVAMAMQQAQTRAVQASQQRTNEANGAAQLQQQGVDWLRNYDAQMVNADPLYAAKRPILSSLVANIRQTLPPSAWPAAVQRAYASIPDTVAPAPAPAPAPTSPPPPPAVPRMGPVRPAGTSPNMTPQFSNVTEALEAGLRAAGMS